MFGTHPDKTPFDLYAAICFAVYAGSLGPIGYWIIFAAVMPVFVVEWRKERRAAVKVRRMLLAARARDRRVPALA